MNKHVSLSRSIVVPEGSLPDPNLRKGDTVTLDGFLYAFYERDAGGILLGTMKAPLVKRYLSRHEFWTAFYGHSLTINRGDVSDMRPSVRRQVDKPLEQFKKRDVDEALRKLHYVELAIKMQNRPGSKKLPRRDVGYRRVAVFGARLLRRRLAAEAGRKTLEIPLVVPGWSSVRNWLWDYEKSGENLASLVPAHDEKGTDKSKLDPRVEAIIAEVIEKHYLTRQHIPLAAALTQINGRILLLNESLPEHQQLGGPEYKTVHSWLHRHYDDYEIVFARKGPDAAAEMGNLVRRGPVGNHPMHTIQMDYVRLDVVAVNPKGHPLFGTLERSRPWAVAAICTLTGMIVGFHITFMPPSWESALAALNHAVRPKDLSAYPNILGHYPCMGGMKVVQMDNEKAFRSRSVVLGIRSIGATPEYGPAGKANRRGKIERFFRTVNYDFTAFMPGRTFGSPGERGDYDPEKLACFELHEIYERFTRWVVDVRHNTPRGVFRLTPLQMWEKFGGVVHVPPKAADLDSLIAITVERTVQREGVRIFGLRFTARCLEKLLRRSGGKGRRYAIRVNPDDLTMVELYNDLEHKWEILDCVTPEYVRDIGLEEWRQVLVLARKMNSGMAPSRVHLLKATMALNAEAAARGPVPTRRMKAEAVIRFQEEIDDPLYEIIDEDIPRRKRRDPQRTGTYPPALEAEDGDLATEVVTASLAQDNLPAKDKAIPENTGKRSAGSTESKPSQSPPSLEPYRGYDDIPHDPDNPHDPRNWSR